MNKTDNSRIWLAVVNGYAASRKAGSSWRRVKEVLDKKGIDFHATMTGKAGNASELTFDACMAGYRRILAVGGDGTAHDVLNGIAAFVDWGLETGRDISFSDFTLGVIPLGSGNDWVKSLGIERNIVKAAEVLSSGVIVSQDVVRASMLDCSCLPERSEISVSYMVNVGGIGIDARVEPGIFDRITPALQRSCDSGFVVSGQMVIVIRLVVCPYSKIQFLTIDVLQ